MPGGTAPGVPGKPEGVHLNTLRVPLGCIRFAAAAVLLLISHPVPSMPPIDDILHEAAGGSRKELYALARRGGEGAWFALAERALAAGRHDLAAELRKKSYRRDPAPFARIALTRLLIDNPRSITRAEAELRRAEKRFGPHESLRRARIAVLASRQRYEDLAEEMDGFTGRDWEAPMLAAALQRGRRDEDMKTLVRSFILHARDPGVLEIMPPVIDEIAGAAYSRLMAARSARLAEEHEAALDEYRAWLKLRTENPGSPPPRGIPPIFTEIAASARETRTRARWAETLLDASGMLTGAEAYAAAYQAGRLFRELGRLGEAGAAFISAAAAAPDNAARDRALWYRLRTLQDNRRGGTGEELEAFSWAAGLWSRSEGFSDLLERFVHRRVRRGEWAILENHYTSWKHRWPPAARADAALALAFAAAEGRWASKSMNVYLAEAAEAAPLSWAGLRAAGLLNEPLQLNPRPGIEEVRDIDREAELLLGWGMAERIGHDILKNPFTYNDSVVRAAARKLADIHPRTSIRVSLVLRRRPGFSPGREDLLHEHPLPYPSEAAEAAAAYGVPPELFYGLIRVESGWDTEALSRSGARGLTQFMPATWDEWIRRLKYPPDTSPSDPVINLRMGAAYLDWLREREWTSGWLDALVSYNAGGRRLRDWRGQRPGLGDDLFGMSVPVNESRLYIEKVMAAATFYGYLYDGRSPGELHRSWGMSRE